MICRLDLAHDLGDVSIRVDDERRALHAHVLLPYMLFSTHVPYFSATSCSSSESKVNGSPCYRACRPSGNPTVDSTVVIVLSAISVILVVLWTAR